ncbi:hypothetical protein [Saliphagus infecundisoli]|uniref:Uncharacterized protein n=1 Tax=Saliphagus infecundisoli TaxID=1849069 RepID=A0ABD5QIX1_9EURY|nr:hypothetical protein [Saliphagus infecundisoli]
MDDNAPGSNSPTELARRLETVAADLRVLETHLPAPLTLEETRRELTATAGACRRVADSRSGTETESDPATLPERRSSEETSRGDR